MPALDAPAPAHTPGASFERTYGVPRAWITALNAFGVLFVLASGWGLALQDTHRVVFRILTAEHGPVELLSFAGFLVAAVLAARVSLRARRMGEPRGVVITYAVFAAIGLLAAMEEISWGQALFNFRTPFGLGSVNEQGELNVHNLPGMMDLNSAFLFAFGVAGLIAVRAGRSPRFAAVAAPAALAPLFAWITFMGALEITVDLVIIQYTFDIIVGVLAEAVEMLMAFACCAYAWLNGLMLERRWREAGVASTAPAPAHGGRVGPG